MIPSNQEGKEWRRKPGVHLRLSNSIRLWSVVVKTLDQEGESLGTSLTQPPTWPPYFQFMHGSHIDLECLNDKEIRIWSFSRLSLGSSSGAFNFVPGVTGHPKDT